MPTLGQKLKKLNRRYHLVTGYRFFYNSPDELERGYNRVKVYLLLHADFGMTLMMIDTGHSSMLPAGWWGYLRGLWINEAWPKIQEHLAVNGHDYQLADVIGFSGVPRAVSKSRHSGASKKRHRSKSARV